MMMSYSLSHVFVLAKRNYRKKLKNYYHPIFDKIGNIIRDRRYMECINIAHEVYETPNSVEALRYAYDLDWHCDKSFSADDYLILAAHIMVTWIPQHIWDDYYDDKTRNILSKLIRTHDGNYFTTHRPFRISGSPYDDLINYYLTSIDDEKIVNHYRVDMGEFDIRGYPDMYFFNLKNNFMFYVLKNKIILYCEEDTLEFLKDINPSSDEFLKWFLSFDGYDRQYKYYEKIIDIKLNYI